MFEEYAELIAKAFRISELPRDNIMGITTAVADVLLIHIDKK
jgi:hypothetical protein